jgi:hypothetical protein
MRAVSQANGWLRLLAGGPAKVVFDADAKPQAVGYVRGDGPLRGVSTPVRTPRGGNSLTVEIALISVNNTVDGGATHRGADTSDFFDRRRPAPERGGALVCLRN